MTSVPDAAPPRLARQRAPHDARARPHRRLAHQHRRTGHAPGTPDDHHAGLPLVRRLDARGQHQRHVGPVTATRRVGCRRRLDPDVDHDDLAGVRAPGLEHEARLARREGDRAVGPHRRPGVAPVSPSTPDGMSTASTARAGSVARGDPRRVTFEGAAEAGAVHRVDHDVGRRSARVEPRAVDAGGELEQRRRGRPSREHRAATRPSPPLLPFPQTTTTRAP